MRTMQRIKELAVADETRRGNILLLSTGVLVGVLSFTAFTVDIGYIALTKSQLQLAADGAALAGAMELNPVMDQAQVEAAVKEATVELAALNRAGDHNSVLLNPDTDVELGRRNWDAASQSYTYNFGPAATPYNVVRVTARRTEITGLGADGQPYVAEDRRQP